jgi:SPX domain protein involved in polyphosphate accumulation
MADSKTIDVFQRVEDKYRISRREAREILNEMKGYIKKDQYFQYTVHNIYYDSPDSQMIISSLNSDRFKEKLRLRCYEQPSDDTLCFLETKKKFGDIVYKKKNRAES